MVRLIPHEFDRHLLSYIHESQIYVVKELILVAQETPDAHSACGGRGVAVKLHVGLKVVIRGSSPSVKERAEQQELRVTSTASKSWIARTAVRAGTVNDNLGCDVRNVVGG